MPRAQSPDDLIAEVESLRRSNRLWERSYTELHRGHMKLIARSRAAGIELSDIVAALNTFTNEEDEAKKNPGS